MNHAQPPPAAGPAPHANGVHIPAPVNVNLPGSKKITIEISCDDQSSLWQLVPRILLVAVLVWTLFNHFLVGVAIILCVPTASRILWCTSESYRRDAMPLIARRDAPEL